MIIKNANVFKDINGKFLFEKDDICIKDGFIVDSTGSDEEIIDADGCYAIPGLIDLHFHGAMGKDFSDGTTEAFTAISNFEGAHGVTSLCPCTLTLPEPELVSICETASRFIPSKNGADLVGIHLEGPFLNLDKIGAQNPNYLALPTGEAFNNIYNASGGLVKIISLAPEVPGGIEFIKEFHSKVSCSVAHTTADYELASAAFAAGANHVTHLYNAMNPFLHRAPGVVGAAFDSPHVLVELITDGVHIHPAVVRSTLKMFGTDRVIFISDSMMATGLEDGNYSLGGLPVIVKDGRAVLENGTIAGSTTTLMGCLQNAVLNIGVPLEAAVTAASVNPAKALEIYETHGSLSVGKTANIVLLDKNLQIQKVVLRGNTI